MLECVRIKRANSYMAENLATRLDTEGRALIIPIVMVTTIGQKITDIPITTIIT
jgi:hypothetical protein